MHVESISELVSDFRMSESPLCATVLETKQILIILLFVEISSEGHVIRPNVCPTNGTSAGEENSKSNLFVRRRTKFIIRKTQMAFDSFAQEEDERETVDALKSDKPSFMAYTACALDRINGFDNHK